MEEKTEIDYKDQMSHSLRSMFDYQAPKPHQEKKIKELRRQYLKLVHDLHVMCPEGRNKAIGLRKLAESLMWFNKSIIFSE